jgi:hypothetical protein
MTSSISKCDAIFTALPISYMRLTISSKSSRRSAGVADGGELVAETELDGALEGHAAELSGRPGDGEERRVKAAARHLRRMIVTKGTSRLAPTTNIRRRVGSVGGDVKLTLGGGDNTVTTGGATIGGKLDIKSGDGDDVATLVNASLYGDTKVALGDGTNVFTLANSGVLADVDVNAKDGNVDVSASSTGDLRIKVGDGLNTVTVANSTPLKVDVKTGSDDHVEAIGCAVGEEVRMLVGKGANTLAVTNSAIGTDVMKAGAGNDTAGLSGSAVGGTRKIDLGGGMNTLP